MKIIKKYCDICGKEEDDDELLPYHDIYSGKQIKELCWNCYHTLSTSLDEKIRELKKIEQKGNEKALDKQERN